MIPEHPLTPEPVRARRRWLPVAVAVLVILVALTFYAMRRNASSAAKPEDCETKPPPNTFAVAECDAAGAPVQPKLAAPGSNPAPPRP